MPEDRSRFPSAYDRARSRDVGMAPQQEAPVSARIRTLIFDALGGNSPDMAKRRRAMRAADMLTGAGAEFAVGMTPVLGDAQAMYEAKQAYDQGNMGRAAILGGLGALGMVPGVGDAAQKAGSSAVKRIFHGTSPESARSILSKGFDINKSADGTIWLIDNPKIGEVAATGKGAVIPVDIDESVLKLGGWADTDSYSVNELMQMGYDGVKLEDADGITYKIFNPEKLKIVK